MPRAIEVNGKSYTIPKHKAIVWRRFMEFQEEKKDMTVVEAMTKMCELIILLFGAGFPAKTADELMEIVDTEEIIPLYNEAYDAINGQLIAKMEQLPKDGPAEEKSQS